MAGPRPAPAATTLTPRDIFLILRRHILLIISLTVVGLIMGGVAWYFLLIYAPKYSAQTLIKILPPVEKDPTKIGVGIPAKEIQYGHRQTMAALMRQQSTLQELLGKTAVQNTKWFKHFGNIEYERYKCIAKGYKDLKKHFGVHPQRDSDFLVISMTCGDGKEAALIVNEMQRLFLKSQGSKKEAEVAEKLAALEDRRDMVQGELTLIEDTLSNIREQFNLTDIEERNFQHTITLRLADLESQENEIVLEMSLARADMNNLQAQATGPVTELVKHQVENDPTMVVLLQQLAFQESLLNGMLTKFGENHRVIREAQERINAIREERRLRKADIAEQTRQANLQFAQNQLAVLAGSLEQLEKMRKAAAYQKMNLDLARVQYAKQVSLKDERKTMLNSIKEQVDLLRIMQKDPETPKVQYVGAALEPLEISSPKLKIYLPAGTVLGFLMGIALAFLIETLNDLVRTPRDVARYLHIRLLGIIPDMAEDRQTRGIDPCLVVHKVPYSILSESYRQLRTNLKLSSPLNPSSVFLISSGAPRDGKTSVAVNLATTFVVESKRVLLIDANFWQPILHKVFPVVAQQELEPSPLGLSSLLAGKCTEQQAIRPTGIEDLDLIDAGPLPSNPTELIDSVRMQELINRQRNNYDYVIIDGPPLLLVSDAKILAGLVDYTILVVNADTTTRGAALRTIRELTNMDAKIAGCVLLAAKAMKGGYFHEQFKSFQKYQKLQLASSI